MIDQDKRGKLIWGEGSLQGWNLAAGHYQDRERTVRNALLAALKAEDQGEPAKAAKVLLFELPSGQAVWEAIQEGLGHWATSLRNDAIRESSDELEALPEEAPSTTTTTPEERGAEAARCIAARTLEERNPVYDLEPGRVGKMVKEMVSFVGHSPLLHTHTNNGGALKTMVWQWWDGNGDPSNKVWLAVEVEVKRRMARKLEELPEWVPGQTRQALAKVRRVSAKVKEERESMGDTFTEAFRARGVEPEGSVAQVKKDLPGEAWLKEINAQSIPPHHGVARASRNGDRSCELCMAPVTKGHQYVATKATSRRRSHLSCYKQRQPSYSTSEGAK
jgi:hypothetical protein